MEKTGRYSFRITFFSILLLLSSQVVAGPYDPPANYYNSATGTGSTLKNQLDSIMTTGHSLLTYGDARYILDETDQDPSNPNNVLLTYHRTSVSGTWNGSGSGTIFNSREHVWPSSFRPDGSPSNGTTSIGSDLHMLKPLDSSTNSLRGHRAFGFASTTGPNGRIGDDYYFPGEADRGDMARIMFYGATRWKDEGLDLVNGAGNSSTYDMGDLASLLEWHYIDPPDDFELRRNHLIDGEQNNRNAYIDRPEFVWSVFKDQQNDSQLYVGGSPAADGSSTLDLDFKTIVGGSAPGNQNVTLNRNGNDGTYYEITTTGDATSSVTGRLNAFAINTSGTDSRSLTIGLDNVNTSSTGQQTGSVVIDNLDITTSGGTGRGANDGDDVINITLDVLDHATPSWTNTNGDSTLVLDLGNVPVGSPLPTVDFDIFNLETTAGFTADLELDSITPFGDTGVLTTDLSTFTGGSALAAGTNYDYTASLDTSTPGTYGASYTLEFSDEDISGATSAGSLLLVLTGTVESPSFLEADFNEDTVVDDLDLVQWEGDYGLNGDSDANGDGFSNGMDFLVWQEQRGQTSALVAATSAVPEPSSALLLVVGAIFCRRHRR